MKLKQSLIYLIFFLACSGLIVNTAMAEVSDEQVLANASQQWESKYPKDEILALRFVDQNWESRNEFRYNNVSGRYQVNISSLEVKVVVKKDKHVAIIYPVLLMKDHLKGDALSIDSDTGKNNAFFALEILLKNLKL